jgi:hypothetical protein
MELLRIVWRDERAEQRSEQNDQQKKGADQTNRISQKLTHGAPSDQARR